MPEALINASKDARKRNDAIETAEFEVKTLSAKNSAKLSEDEIATLEKARKLIASSPPYLKRASGQIEARAKYRMTAKGRPEHPNVNHHSPPRSRRKKLGKQQKRQKGTARQTPSKVCARPRGVETPLRNAITRRDIEQTDEIR
jgi:hypothetical protein